MISRRDFLKFSPLVTIALFGKKPPTAQTESAFDITAAFANVQNGGVIDIPPGTYYASALSLRNKQDVTVRANHAKIFNCSLDMAGAGYCTVNDLFLFSHQAIHPAGIILGRTAESSGGSNAFHGGYVGGSYTGVSVYNCCHEGNTFDNFYFQTETDKPALINSSQDILGLGLVESSNCLLYLDKCNFMNYGTAPHLVLAKGFVSGMSIKDSYCFLGNGGTFLKSESVGDGFMIYLTLSNIRAEGTGNCLLVDYSGRYVGAWNIERIAWQIESDYIMQADNWIVDSRLDFAFCMWSYARKWLHMTNGAQLFRVDTAGDWTDRIVTE